MNNIDFILNMTYLTLVGVAGFVLLFILLVKAFPWDSEKKVADKEGRGKDG